MTTDAPETEPADAEHEAWDPASDPDGYTDEDVRRKDWYLDVVLTLVHGANDQRADGLVGLTVTSSGAVVSGLAISRLEWIAGVTEQYQDTGNSEAAAAIAEMFNVFHDESISEATRRRDAELPSAARKFLHMKDVRMSMGSNFIQLPYWRGSLADITSWAMGSWNAGQEEHTDT